MGLQEITYCLIVFYHSDGALYLALEIFFGVIGCIGSILFVSFLHVFFQFLDVFSSLWLRCIYHFFRFQMLVAQRQRDEELASFLPVGFIKCLVVGGCNGSVVQFHERTGQVETDSRTYIPVIRSGGTLIEALENRFELFLLNALAAVLDGDADMMRRVGEGDTDSAACRSKLEGV